MKNSELVGKFAPFIKPHSLILVISLLLTVIVVFFDAISLWFTGTLLQIIFSSDATAPIKPEVSFSTVNELLKYYTWKILELLGDGSKTGVLNSVVVCIPILFFLKNVSLYIQKVTMNVFNLRMVEDMRNSFYSHILHLPMTYFDKNRSGDVISLIVRDLTAVKDAMVNTLNKLIMEPMKVIFFFSLLIIINAKLTIIVLLVYPFLGFFIGWVGKMVRKRSHKMFRSFSDVVAVITETVNGVRLVKMFDGLNYEKDKFHKENRILTKQSIKETMVKQIMSPFTEFVSLGMTSLLLWYSGSEILSGKSDFAADDFLRYLIILFSAYAPIKRLTQVHAEFQTGLAAADRVVELFNAPIELDNGEEILPEFNDKLEVKNLTFNYPGHNEIVLKDITFSVNKGKMVALVGSSGSGKSTILDLLPRLYEYQNGEVLIDGVSTKDLTLGALRSHFGIVSQETILFNDSVLVNITYGDNNPDMEKVERVIKAANAEEFINKLQDGINTVIGERGVTLSGGQQQRLAIARALYRNPDILVLDEATSALDTESEKLVQNAIDNLIKDRTTVVVAHRLSTIRRADEIIVLDAGQIVEKGSHEELYELNGRYRYLYDIQFQD